jgi:hypothetical protein
MLTRLFHAPDRRCHFDPFHSGCSSYDRRTLA